MTLQALELLHDSTRYQPFPKVGDFLNLTTRETYMLSWLADGGTARERIQNGLGAEFRAMVDLGGPNGQGTATTTIPGEAHALVPKGNIKKRNVGWKFIVDHDTVTEQEVVLNHMAPTPPERQLIDILELKDEGIATAMTHKWEDTLGAVPVATKMEGTFAREPYSLFSYITESSTGLPITWGSSTLAGWDPSEISGWDNKRGTYARYDHTTGSGKVLSQSLSEMIRRTKMPTLPIGMYANAERQGTMPPSAIGCSHAGYRNYEFAALKSDNADPLRSSRLTDLGFPPLAIDGIPFLIWDVFETAAIYDDGSSGYANEAGADLAGPRYYGINKRDLFPMIHGDHYFKKLPMRDVANQPYDRVMWRSLWVNLACKDRRSQFIVSPSTDITNA